MGPFAQGASSSRTPLLTATFSTNSHVKWLRRPLFYLFADGALDFGKAWGKWTSDARTVDTTLSAIVQ